MFPDGKIVDSLYVAPVRMAEVKSAPDRSAFDRPAFVRSAFVRSTFVRTALDRFASIKWAKDIVALVRIADQPIGGLEDGKTYYVDYIDDFSFSLLEAANGNVIGLDFLQVKLDPTHITQNQVSIRTFFYNMYKLTAT